MRAPVSILIPTLNDAGELPAALACLAEGLNAGLVRELILSDGGSTDEIARLADAAGARLIAGPPGRGGQLARAAATAKGDWLLVLHADTRLAPGWSGAVIGHLREHPGRAGYFRLCFRAGGMAPRLVAGWANLRAALLGLPYGDQGLLISRAHYDRVGGYPEIPLMEDVAMARALRGALRPLPAIAATSARRYEAGGWLRQGSRNIIRLVRFLLGADPETLARSYPGAVPRPRHSENCNR